MLGLKFSPQRMSKETDFVCLGKRRLQSTMLGDCHHRSPPEDGVWKIAPSQLKKLEDAKAKYECLVHYARTDNGANHPAPRRFPVDCENLDGVRGDWYHGFNSGVLASLRLVMALCLKDQAEVERIENNIPLTQERWEELEMNNELDAAEEAKSGFEEFPFLDT
jgi:hypothetical protein